MNKKFVALICAALAAGLIVGAGAFHSDLQLPQELPMGINVVHVYLQVLNVSDGAGIAPENMVFSVIVLNMTNPNSEALRLTILNTVFAANTTAKDGQVTSWDSPVGFDTPVMQYRYYPQESINFTVAPNSSRLLGFTTAQPYANIMADTFSNQKGYFYASMSCFATDPKISGTGVVLREVSLEKLRANEYVYNTLFKDSYFEIPNHLGMQQLTVETFPGRTR